VVTLEQRAASIALRRVAGNFGMGAGATVAGFIVASADHLRTFQALYLFDAATFAVFALVVLLGIPNPRRPQPASCDSATASPTRSRRRNPSRCKRHRSRPDPLTDHRELRTPASLGFARFLGGPFGR
jgi:hypothetical protein